MCPPTTGNDTSPSLSAVGAAPRSAHDYVHPCGYVSSWGRCELYDKVDTLPSLWGVAEVAPATSDTAEHLHPFQYCGDEQSAVGIWAHHSARDGRPRAAVSVIRRDRRGQRWEATL